MRLQCDLAHSDEVISWVREHVHSEREAHHVTEWRATDSQVQTLCHVKDVVGEVTELVHSPVHTAPLVHGNYQMVKPTWLQKESQSDQLLQSATM